jgi:glycosyltransferase involved in cell wall biosynthesis
MEEASARHGTGYTPRMQFSIVVLTWNRKQFLELCLHALLRSVEDRDRCQIIVMDNGSTDGTKEVLAGLAAVEKNFRVITLDRNYGIEAYRKLFDAARGKYIVVVDDDVLEFPVGLDRIFAEYMKAFWDFGYLALNVVQDEFTNGSKPGPESYFEMARGNRTIQVGPAGGWCSCFRRWQYRLIQPLIRNKALNMSYGEDGMLTIALHKYLRLKYGIIRDHVCFHAAGPYYARKYGHLDREIEKYKASGLGDMVSHYESFLGTGSEASSDR